ncbi:MAG: SDR family NAD(P)-dependent oxidoreductase [Janthinobacterium lividum]
MLRLRSIGATSGIGRATALLLNKAGAEVIAVGRNTVHLAELASEFADGGQALRADVGQSDRIAHLMADIAVQGRRLDGLVINAGVSEAPDLEHLDLAAYDRLMDVNVKGAVFTCARALPLLVEGASVVFVGSVAARKGQPGEVAEAIAFMLSSASRFTTGADIAVEGGMSHV